MPPHFTAFTAVDNLHRGPPRGFTVPHRDSPQFTPKIPKKPQKPPINQKIPDETPKKTPNKPEAYRCLLRCSTVDPHRNNYGGEPMGVVLGSIAMVSLGVHVLNPIDNAHTFIRHGMPVVAIVLSE